MQLRPTPAEATTTNSLRVRIKLELQRRWVRSVASDVEHVYAEDVRRVRRLPELRTADVEEWGRGRVDDGRRPRYTCIAIDEAPLSPDKSQCGRFASPLGAETVRYLGLYLSWLTPPSIASTNVAPGTRFPIDVVARITSYPGSQLGSAHEREKVSASKVVNAQSENANILLFVPELRRPRMNGMIGRRGKGIRYHPPAHLDIREVRGIRGSSNIPANDAGIGHRESEISEVSLSLVGLIARIMAHSTAFAPDFSA